MPRPRADVDARRALLRGAMPSMAARGDQVAVERDGAARVVVARDREGRCRRDRSSQSRIGDDRNAELVGFLRSAIVFLVGVDHEHHVGQAAHVLDAAERPLELVALARQLEQLLLGEALALSPASSSSSSRRRLIESEIVFQLVSMPPSQRWLT